MSRPTLIQKPSPPSPLFKIRNGRAADLAFLVTDFDSNMKKNLLTILYVTVGFLISTWIFNHVNPWLAIISAIGTLYITYRHHND